MKLLPLIAPLLFATLLHAEGPPGNDPGPSVGGGAQEYSDPLKVKGQNRKLNMLLNLKGEGDDISFIQLRKKYRKEILKTQY